MFTFILPGLISDSESLFRYEPKKGPADFRFPDFVPIFLDEASAAAKAQAETLCGTSNVACIYDYIATGSQTVAEATKGTKEAADETESNISKSRGIFATFTVRFRFRFYILYRIYFADVWVFSFCCCCFAVVVVVGLFLFV